MKTAKPRPLWTINPAKDSTKCGTQTSNSDYKLDDYELVLIHSVSLIGVSSPITMAALPLFPAGNLILRMYLGASDLEANGSLTQLQFVHTSSNERGYNRNPLLTRILQY